MESSTIGVGDTVQFTATVTNPDGSVVDVTGEVSWSSSDPGVALIELGLATGESEGTTEITATFGDVTSDPVTLTVTAPAELEWWIILAIVGALFAAGLLLLLLLRRRGLQEAGGWTARSRRVAA